MRLAHRAIAVLASPLLASLAMAQQFQPIRGLDVVDGNGRALGSVVDTVAGVYVNVAIPISSGLVLLNVKKYSGLMETNLYLVFESGDCSGPPFMYVPDGIVGYGAIVPPGMTLYVPDLSDVPRDITFRSRQTAVACVPEDGLNTGHVVQAERVIDLATLFAPPFRVVAHAACPGDLNGDNTVTIDEVVSGVNSALMGCPAVK